jgi:hypothetical protein
VRSASDVRQIEVHTAKSLVPGSSLLEVEIAITKLKRYKLSGSVQIRMKLIEAGAKHYICGPWSTNLQEDD